MSVDLGSLQQQCQEGNSGDYLPPAFGGRELSRSESEAPARKGRFGLRSLDLQVSGFLCTALVTAVMAPAGQQRIVYACRYGCPVRATYCNAGSSIEMRSGRSLNVQALPRDDSGPPSEVGARRQKFAAFENACSEVAPGLCVGGGAVAQASEMLSGRYRRLTCSIAPSLQSCVDPLPAHCLW
jgi:hypothetical protein